MDEDGFIMQGSRRGRTNGDSHFERTQGSFFRDVPKYAGTADSFCMDHFRTYGRAEGLGRDGSHPPGSAEFPRNSNRATLYDAYSSSTKPRDNARRVYEQGLGFATDAFKKMSSEEQEYYSVNTGGLRPDQHERLGPRAGLLSQYAYKNAVGRDDFLRSHPHGYHTLEDQLDHHRYAGNAYREAEYARGRKNFHEMHRSYQGDSRRDKFNRGMSRNEY